MRKPSPGTLVLKSDQQGSVRIVIELAGETLESTTMYDRTISSDGLMGPGAEFIVLTYFLPKFLVHPPGKPFTPTSLPYDISRCKQAAPPSAKSRCPYDRGKLRKLLSTGLIYLMLAFFAHFYPVDLCERGEETA